jgi:rubrerythrin
MMPGNAGKSGVLMAMRTVAMGLAVFIVQAPSAWSASNVLTIEALKERHQDEVTAHRAFVAYGERACAEGYPNIAHLFKSLAASEGVHARNFRNLLAGLKVDVKPIAIPGLQEVGTTRDNLKHASGVERDEIDREYPDILERIASEGNQDVITSITHAWKAEQQHRELIVKIHKAASRMFGLLVGRIEGGESHYHVCAVCGSTLTELPAHQCPICAEPVSSYREVEPYPKDACMVTPRDDDWDN